MCDGADYYAVLGVAPGAPQAAIRAAYHARARAVHPDKAGAAADAVRLARVAGGRARELTRAPQSAFHAAREAFGAIGTASHRAAYDAARRGQRSMPVLDEVLAADMVAVEGEGGGALRSGCRCGGAFEVHAAREERGEGRRGRVSPAHSRNNLRF